MSTQSKTKKSDTYYRVMDLIHRKPDITQRELASQTGISLGSVHYCLKAFAHKGWLKVENFKNNPDKSVYLYLLTAEGMSQKTKLAYNFLRRKKTEYDQLKQLINDLSEELNG